MKLCLSLPINSVSFGQISTLLLREIYESKELDPHIFLIGNQVDLSSQENINKEFIDWLTVNLNRNLKDHKRSIDSFKLWHLNGSMESLSNNQTLLSFYELDSPTEEELNIVNNQKQVLFSSQETVDLFIKRGCKNVKYIPLAFDHHNFKKTDKKYFNDDRIVFNLCGKLEKRKNHEKIIKSWIKKYGNNNKYFLQCSIFNPFMKQEDQEKILSSVLQGQKYFNVSFLGGMQKNGMYNDYLNSSNIIIGMSGGEGWGLPEFQSVALGKYGVIMNEHGYKGWANKNNSVLVNSKNKIEAYDGIFFQKGSPFNQGSIFDFDEEEFISAMEKAEQKVKDNPVNEEGLKLQKEFSSKKFLNNLTSILKE